MTKTASKSSGTKKTKSRGNGQGTVYKKPNGKYAWTLTIGYDMSTGERKTKSGTTITKSEAHKELAQAQADLARGVLSAPDKITVAEYAERWLRQQQLSNLPSTVKRYREELNYALKHIGDMPLQGVRPTHLNDLALKLAERTMKHGGTMSPRTQAFVFGRVRALFTAALVEQIINRNPTLGVRRVKTDRQRSGGNPLDLDQLARFKVLGWALYDLGLCRMWPALYLGATLGLRRGEIMALQWDHIDFKRGKLHVRQSRNREETGGEVKDTKTENSNRTLKMPPALIKMLQEHKARQAQERREAGDSWQDTRVVFCTAQGGWLTPDILRPALKTLIKWSDPENVHLLDLGGPGGVPHRARPELRRVMLSGKALPQITPHDLRHTYATTLARKGVPIEVISRNLGHSDVTTTLRIYRHVLETERDEWVVDPFEERQHLPAPEVDAMTPSEDDGEWADDMQEAAD